jgi:hypothetical protein
MNRTSKRIIEVPFQPWHRDDRRFLSKVPACDQPSRAGGSKRTLAAGEFSVIPMFSQSFL